MWCHHCESDVAAEVAAGGHRARCATCGSEIAAHGTPAQATRTREALQLLERWARPQLLDPFQTTPSQRSQSEGRGSDADSEAPPEAESDLEPTDEHEPVLSEPIGENRDAETSEDSSASHVPVEPEAANSAAMAHEEADATDHDGHAENQSSPATLLDSPAPHAPTAFGIHSGTRSDSANDVPRTTRSIPMTNDAKARADSRDVREAISTDSGSDWVALAGQLLAYGGVAVLTVGTTLALWGHFARQPSHVPTGWLVAAAGQMLLFLGIVTLVSSGIEETSADLVKRFDRVAHRLEELERTIDAAASIGERTADRTSLDGARERAA